MDVSNKCVSQNHLDQQRTTKMSIAWSLLALTIMLQLSGIAVEAYKQPWFLLEGRHPALYHALSGKLV